MGAGLASEPALGVCLAGNVGRFRVCSFGHGHTVDVVADWPGPGGAARAPRRRHLRSRRSYERMGGVVRCRRLAAGLAGLAGEPGGIGRLVQAAAFRAAVEPALRWRTGRSRFAGLHDRTDSGRRGILLRAARLARLCAVLVDDACGDPRRVAVLRAGDGSRLALLRWFPASLAGDAAALRLGYLVVAERGRHAPGISLGRVSRLPVRYRRGLSRRVPARRRVGFPRRVGGERGGVAARVAVVPPVAAFVARRCAGQRDRQRRRRPCMAGGAARVGVPSVGTAAGDSGDSVPRGPNRLAALAPSACVRKSRHSARRVLRRVRLARRLGGATAVGDSGLLALRCQHAARPHPRPGNCGPVGRRPRRLHGRPVGHRQLAFVARPTVRLVRPRPGGHGRRLRDVLLPRRRSDLGGAGRHPLTPLRRRLRAARTPSLDGRHRPGHPPVGPEQRLARSAAADGPGRGRPHRQPHGRCPGDLVAAPVLRLDLGAASGSHWRVVLVGLGDRYRDRLPLDQRYRSRSGRRVLDGCGSALAALRLDRDDGCDHALDSPAYLIALCALRRQSRSRPPGPCRHSGDRIGLASTWDRCLRGAGLDRRRDRGGGPDPGSVGPPRLRSLHPDFTSWGCRLSAWRCTV